MRTTLLPIALAIATAAFAQPDLLQRFTNPCDLPAPDSVDITSDGIADLLVRGWSMGTCDVPSSAGSCVIHVITLPGTQVLCGLDALGGRVPQAFDMGDTIPLPSMGVRDDQRIPRFSFAEVSIDALRWGYGRSGLSALVVPEPANKFFVFVTIAGEQVVRGCFTIEQLADQRSVHIKVGGLVHSDEVLIAH